MKFSNTKKNNKGMTVPELVMAMLMLTAFTGVFVVVTKFTSNFMQPINIDGERNFEYAKDISLEENEMVDIMNDHFQI